MEDQFLQTVKTLKEQNLSQRDMAEKLNVPRSWIQKALKQLQPPENNQTMLPEEKLRSIIREELKAAHDAEQEEKDKSNSRFPMIRKTGGGEEVIAPEAVLTEYMGNTPEGEIELRAIMKFRAAMLMVMDLVNIQKSSAEADAKRLVPILSLMKETREEQDAAAARAKASSEEIADRAATQVANQLFGAVSQNNAQVTGTLDQIRQMLSGKSDDPFSRLLSMMQSMQQLSQMFGMPMPGMMPGAPAVGGQAPQVIQPIEKHNINELEGK